MDLRFRLNRSIGNVEYLSERCQTKIYRYEIVFLHFDYVADDNRLPLGFNKFPATKNKRLPIVHSPVAAMSLLRAEQKQQ
jgi:hypothetical protein